MNTRGNRKQLEIAELAQAIAMEREAGCRIVLTNGCFDLLHAGHLHLLSEASRQGDRLIVAINSDASVRRLKGPGRPVQTFEVRAAGLASLREVDWIVGFSDLTPLQVIDRLLPDVLVKGDDWAADEIVGRESVEANGGKVVRVSRLRGQSTTETLARGAGTDLVSWPET